MENFDKGFTEVYYIISRLDEDEKKKIPNEIVEGIKESMDKSYIPDEANLSEMGKAILSVIYSDFLCDEKEKKNWDDMDNLYFESLVKKSKKNYDLKFNQMDDQNNQSTDLIEKKSDSFIEKIRCKIKQIFSSIKKK